MLINCLGTNVRSMPCIWGLNQFSATANLSPTQHLLEKTIEIKCLEYEKYYKNDKKIQNMVI